MTTLIIGGDSRLSKRLIKTSKIKYSTTRRVSKSKNNLYLDLKNTDSFIIPEDVTNCVIIGGPVSYDQSKNDISIVQKIHQLEIPKLTLKLLQKGIYTIYISSNMVLGKKSLDRAENALPQPNIAYGKMKCLCEKSILDKVGGFYKFNKLAFLRLTKNISPETSPFNNWIENYHLSKDIYAFNDLFMSPICFEESSKVIKKMLALKKSGIFHFSGEKDINYYQFCCEINKILERKNRKILKAVEVKSFERGVNLEDTGKITRLDMRETSRSLNIKPLKIEEICEYFSNLLC